MPHSKSDENANESAIFENGNSDNSLPIQKSG